MEVQCHNEREAKEKKFLRDVARYGFAVQKILQDDRINHRKILNLLTSSPNHAHLHSLLTYILEHSLQEIPHTIVNALGKVIVNEDQCDNAI